MKKRILAFLLVVSLTFDFTGGLTYAQEPLIEAQDAEKTVTVQDTLNQENNKQTTNEEKQEVLEAELDSELELEPELEQGLNSDEPGTTLADPDNDDEILKDTPADKAEAPPEGKTVDTMNGMPQELIVDGTEDARESKPENEVQKDVSNQPESEDVQQTKPNDEPKNIEIKEATSPVTEDVVDCVGAGKIFEEDIYNKYKVGEETKLEIGAYVDYDFYNLFYFNDQTTVTFDLSLIDIEDLEEPDVNPQIIVKLHKVYGLEESEDYESLGCVFEKSLSYDTGEANHLTFTQTLAPSYYVLEVSTKSDKVYYYNLKTTDITTYASSLQIPADFYVAVCEKQKLNVTNIIPAGASAGIRWKTSDSKIASVNKNGIVHGWKYGTCVITATLKNSKTYSCKVYVNAPILNKTSIRLMKGQTYPLKVSKAYQPASYTSSNPAVASVGASSGKITAKGKGTARITAQIGNEKITCKVTVEAPKLSVKTKKIVIGDSFVLKVSGTSQKVSFKSLNKSIATINKKGLVNGKKIGTVKILVTISGQKYTCTVKVIRSNLKNTTLQLPTGVKKKLEWKRKVKKVKWSSENKKIATVNSKGIVTAKKAGTTKIVAEADGIRYFCVVKCENPILSDSSMSLDKGKTKKLSVIGSKMKVVYRSTNSSIASVSAKGIITGKIQGTVKIIAKIGGKELSCTVTVLPDRPNFYCDMSGEFVFDTYGSVIQVKNYGNYNMRIYSAGAYMTNMDSRYVSITTYDAYFNQDILELEYIDIPPGQSMYLVFLVRNFDYSTYYWAYTTLTYRFEYDGVIYEGKNSYYEPSSYDRL